CVLAQNAWERAIAPGMWLARRQLAVRRERRAVGPDHDRRMRQRAAEIALVELEQDHIPLAAFVDNQLERGVERVHPPFGRDLRDSLPLGVLAPGRGGDHDVLPPDAVEQALAAPRRLDVAPEPRATLWIGRAVGAGVAPPLGRAAREARR